MSDSHLRFSGLDEQAQRAALEGIIRQSELHMRLLAGLRDLDLPDWLLVSGILYNYVWNVLTNNPSLHGVRDADVFYFDATDLSYEAEDRRIQQVNARFDGFPVPVELRNQARVHLWYADKFGAPFSPLRNSAEMLDRFASRTHAVGVRLEADDSMTIVAPFGLDDMFSFRVVPNHSCANERAHHEKGERAMRQWPEITFQPW
ncbi:MAG: nucleotidyltransferase family protein [Hyphomicrobiaceae bacterium]|nr:nucleotidyltransferase family protein [Hyphomicrobiaceae bacterium]MCC0025097.1 nucleotidyltransferase family protein [Hyphomicrobiaceae bacterium]